MKKLFFLFLLAFNLNANAGFFYRDLEFIGMENFTVEKKGDRIYVGFDYVINNPNWYGVVIKPSHLNLTIAGVDCGSVKIAEKIKIKRKREGNYPFVLIGDASRFVKSGFSSIWSLMTGQGVDFTLKGKINAGVAVYKRKWPLDYTYKMSFEEFLSFF